MYVCVNDIGLRVQNFSAGRQVTAQVEKYQGTKILKLFIGYVITTYFRQREGTVYPTGNLNYTHKFPQ